MGKISFLRIAGLFMVTVFGFFIVQNPLSGQYVEKLKADSLYAMSAKDALYIEIEEKKAHFEKPPIDAKVDPVWKKIPGYNGIRVDVESSYKKMKESGIFHDKLLVYKEVPPKIHLEDLPPAPIFKGNPEKKMVALTINVAWGNEYVSPILQTLKKHSVQATFFVEGRWAKQNPDLVKMIHEGGHEIGNHSFTHPDFRKLGNEQIKKELTDTNQVITATVGYKPKWFAPPSGSFNDQTIKIAHNLNMHTVMWTVDTIDWQKPSPETLINRVVKQLHNGAIILMHPTESTEKALDQLITEIKKNYRPGSVSQLVDEGRILE